MENKRLRAKGDREASVVGGGFEIRTVKSALCVCVTVCVHVWVGHPHPAFWCGRMQRSLKVCQSS